MPKDYWQPEDIGHIEETEGFPLPPVDADGKNLDYVWVPSKSLRALSAACKRMSAALVGGEVMHAAHVVHTPIYISRTMIPRNFNLVGSFPIVLYVEV